MKKYLLDSDTVSDFYDKFSEGYPYISSRLSSLKDTDEIFVSILTLYEFEYGYANAPDEKKGILRQKIKEMQQDFKILHLSTKSAEQFGSLKKALKDLRGLKKENIKKHNVDIIIAASAISENCILISNDDIYDALSLLNPELKSVSWHSCPDSDNP
jgi:predicted nucleic acid-binding protein